MNFKDVLALQHSREYKKIAYGGAPQQFGELWLPDVADENVPLVVLVHGGCWLNAFGIDHTRAMSNALVNEGFAVWSLEYRRLGDAGGGWPGSVQDIIEGIVFLTSSKRIDREFSRVVLMGHSAGGHLALASLGDQRVRARVDRVIGLAAIVDPMEYAKGDNSCQKAGKQLLEEMDVSERKSGVEFVPSLKLPKPKIVFVHGDQDPIVPLAHVRSRVESVQIVKGAGHFDVIHPGTSAWQVIRGILARE